MIVCRKSLSDGIIFLCRKKSHSIFRIIRQFKGLIKKTYIWVTSLSMTDCPSLLTGVMFLINSWPADIKYTVSGLVRNKYIFFFRIMSGFCSFYSPRIPRQRITRDDYLSNIEYDCDRKTAIWKVNHYSFKNNQRLHFYF